MSKNGLHHFKVETFLFYKEFFKLFDDYFLGYESESKITKILLKNTADGSCEIRPQERSHLRGVFTNDFLDLSKKKYVVCGCVE